MENGRRTIKTDLTERIAAVVARLKPGEPLRNHTTYRIGGPARYYAEVDTAEQLIGVHALALKERLPFLLIGNGSNILFGDAGFPGIVVRLTGRFAEFSRENETVIRCGAGVQLGALVKYCSEHVLAGPECLAGIPGTVGGALMSNAGTSAGWIGDFTAAAEVLSETGQIIKIDRKDISFSYRSSSLEGRMVTGAVFYLKKGQKNDIVNTINGLMERRSAAQPIGTRNAGSVFKNPPNNSAGRLIETCGLKGLKFGGAQISEKHANFIVNTGEAKASDVRALITMAHQKVKERFGIDLELEIKLIGE